MTYRQAIDKSVSALGGGDDARRDIFVLLQFLTGLDKTGLLLKYGEECHAEVVEKLQDVVSRRRKGEPVAYITGRKDFMGFTFRVGPDVLIPRPDTEILVLRALSLIEGRGYGSVLEMATGSGCIAISLSKLTACSVAASDISHAAIRVAMENAKVMSAKVKFIQSDCFTNISGKYDLIVSNPPYLTEAELLNFEPRLALYGGEDGLDFYRKITCEAPTYLNIGGALAFEIGYNQRRAVESIMEAAGFCDITCEADLSGFDRVIWGMWHGLRT